MKLNYNLIIACLVLAGCGPVTGDPNSTPNDPSVYKDRETGCEYLARKSDASGGLTPRLDETGKQICRKDKNEH